MTPADIDRVFGRGRLRMTTGEHVEVFREEAKEGEPRTFTKRFLETSSGDFRPWTEREWRILERLAAGGDVPVAQVVRFIDFDDSGLARLQTRDAGPTVDQWAALVPLRRSSPVLPYVFGDCANWWALARQCLIALDKLHGVGFVHLEFRSDNVCIPWKPAEVERPGPGQPLAPNFDALALIDVAFSLLPDIELPEPLPLAREPGYEYQSPRLLQALGEARRGNLAPTFELDWRCDIFSLAAMLWRYLPELDDAAGTGWTSQRHASASAFVRQLLEVHGAPLPAQRPHSELIAQAGLRLTDPQLAAALQAGSTFDPERAWPHGAEAMPLTRIAPVAAARATRAARREPAATSTPRSTAAPVAAPAPAAAAASVASAAPGAPAVSAASMTPASAEAPTTVATATAPAEPKAAPAPVAPPAKPAPWATPARVVGSAAAAAVAPAATQIATRTADAPLRTDATSPAAASAATEAPSTVARSQPARPISAPTASTAQTSVQPTPARSTAAPIAAAARIEPTAAPPSTAAPTAERIPAAAPSDSAQRPHIPVRPYAPTSTPVPILAAAGIGALLLAGAAWWGIEGRNSSDRAAQRAAAVPAAGASSTSSEIAANPSPAPREVAAGPTRSDDSASAAVAAPPAPAMSTSAAASSVAAASASASVATAAAPAGEIASAPAPAASDAAATQAANSAFETTADDWIRNRIPRLAQGAERQVAPVLALAARTSEMRRRGEIRNAARAMRGSTGATAPDAQANAAQARSLNDAALSAYWRDDNMPDALRFETQAFGANPFDSEVVGNLAFLSLKEKPPQAETARQLALHALTVQDPRFATGRIEDWTTLAIASALTGRDADARNAWFVSMALASDLQRQCDAAMRAQATYGERLRPSVQAMLLRARSSPAYGRCELARTPAAHRAKASSKTGGARKPRRTIP